LRDCIEGLLTVDGYRGVYVAVAKERKRSDGPEHHEDVPNAPLIRVPLD